MILVGTGSKSVLNTRGSRASGMGILGIVTIRTGIRMVAFMKSTSAASLGRWSDGRVD